MSTAFVVYGVVASINRGCWNASGMKSMKPTKNRLNKRQMKDNTAGGKVCECRIPSGAIIRPKNPHKRTAHCEFFFPSVLVVYVTDTDTHSHKLTRYLSSVVRWFEHEQANWDGKLRFSHSGFALFDILTLIPGRLFYLPADTGWLADVSVDVWQMDGYFFSPVPFLDQARTYWQGFC